MLPEKQLKMKKQSKSRKPAAKTFSVADWHVIYEALVDAASVHHSGPRADRYSALADRVREEKLS